MKIGIYLAYAPAKNLSMKKEGLGRYLAYITKGLIEDGNKVIIACPTWLLDSLYELFSEHEIKKQDVEIITPKNTSVFLKFILKWINRKQKNKKETKSFFKAAVLKTAETLVDYFVSTTSFLIFFAMLGIMVIIGLCILPLIVFLEICYFFTYAICKLFRVRRILEYLNIKKIFKFLLRKIGILNRLYTRYILNREFISVIRENTSKDLIRRINGLKDDVDIWYSPTAFWPEFNSIIKKKVVCAPDIVTTKFPVNFSTYGNVEFQTETVRKTLEEGEFFITYCEFIKKDLLINQLHKNEKNIISIPHATNDMSSTILMDPKYKLYRGDEIEERLARRILEGIKEKSLYNQKYIGCKNDGLAFRDIEYIFYASQVRGNKNFLNLIKAYEILLKKYNINEKLILTGNVKATPEIMDYILLHKLQNDILCFTDVTNQQLGALYRCAKLVVNPTLYEGGFNFTFGEGMSVGTPSIMGNIPQVIEVIEGYGLEGYYYDPYNVEDIALKIKYGLENLDDLYQKELTLFNDLNKRSWATVGREYVEAFKYFIGLSNTN